MPGLGNTLHETHHLLINNKMQLLTTMLGNVECGKPQTPVHRHSWRKLFFWNGFHFFMFSGQSEEHLL